MSLLLVHARPTPRPPPAQLRFPLLNKNLVVHKQTIVQRFSQKAATQARDALAKVIFAALFDFLVERINAVSRGPSGCRSIGILDIFGFECLKTNSFEQLCINYVNEMLQEQFNESVFAAEGRLLRSEGIEGIDSGTLQVACSPCSSHRSSLTLATPRATSTPPSAAAVERRAHRADDQDPDGPRRPVPPGRARLGHGVLPGRG